MNHELNETTPSLDIVSPLVAKVWSSLCGEGKTVKINLKNDSYSIEFFINEHGKNVVDFSLPLEIGGEIAVLSINYDPNGNLAKQIQTKIPHGNSILRTSLMSIFFKNLLNSLESIFNSSISLSNQKYDLDQLHSIGMRFLRKDGTVELWGTMWLSEIILKSLLIVAHNWGSRSGVLTEKIPIECPVFIGDVTLSSDHFFNLQRGDVLIIGGYDEISGTIKLPDGRKFSCLFPKIFSIH